MLNLLIDFLTTQSRIPFQTLKNLFFVGKALSTIHFTHLGDDSTADVDIAVIDSDDEGEDIDGDGSPDAKKPDSAQAPKVPSQHDCSFDGV